MTPLDWSFNIILVALVIRQIQGRPLTLVNLLLPIAIVVTVASLYLRAFPTGGNDLILEFGCIALGLVLGLACGFTTRVFRGSQGMIIAKATALSAALWIIGVGSRMIFELFTDQDHSRAITRFSIQHHITSGQAWVAAFVGMALVEVLARQSVIRFKGFTLGKTAAVAEQSPAVDSMG